MARSVEGGAAAAGRQWLRERSMQGNYSMKQRRQMPAVGEECCFNVTHAKWSDATCLQSYEGSGRITCATKAGSRYF